ncbi:MAG: NYN domain-containing protein [Candidatus Rokubacteria bacterium]|nr:NYN domain-containing protein [Candidatus Rokubacteria bacterium]
MRWLVDGYNVIRRSPELRSRECESLESGRQGLAGLLAEAARLSGDRFTVVFDGAGAGGRSPGRAVEMVFSSARETADRLIARLAAAGGAVVSNDREVRRAAARAGAIPVTTDEFLAHLERAVTAADLSPDEAKEDEPEERASPKRGNPRRMPKRRRAAARALRRLRP